MMSTFAPRALKSYLQRHNATSAGHSQKRRIVAATSAPAALHFVQAAAGGARVSRAGTLPATGIPGQRVKQPRSCGQARYCPWRSHPAVPSAHLLAGGRRFDSCWASRTRARSSVAECRRAGGGAFDSRPGRSSAPICSSLVRAPAYHPPAGSPRRRVQPGRVRQGWRPARASAVAEELIELHPSGGSFTSWIRESQRHHTPGRSALRGGRPLT